MPYGTRLEPRGEGYGKETNYRAFTYPVEKTVPFIYETLEAPSSGAVSTPDLNALGTPALLQLWIVWGNDTLVPG